jgi:hypothetical protein
MTEEEARNRWCPFAKIALASENGQIVGYNRIEDAIEGSTKLPTASFCIASRCMAWRWGGRGNTERKQQQEFERKTEGYCGLASKP